MKRNLLILGLIALALTGCKDVVKKKGDNSSPQDKKEVAVKDSTGTVTVSDEPEPSSETFWLGADISWETMMEQHGEHLYNFEGDNSWECTALMKDLGLNAVRLRVWVDPQAWGAEQAEKRKQVLADKPESPVKPAETKGKQKRQKAEAASDEVAALADIPEPEEVEDRPVERPVYDHAGTCDKEDLLEKAMRAQRLGMAIMVDFHYSDDWADAKSQEVPSRWKGESYEQMRQDLKDYTIDVLKYLKDNGVDVKWVQIGNEVSNGLLWSYKTGRDAIGPDGKPVFEESVGNAAEHPDQYAGFIKAGCEAAKSVYPYAKTVVHLGNGWDSALYDWNLGILKQYGVDYDMVGMSLVPYWARGEKGRNDADGLITECMNNVKNVFERFGKESMIVETGFEVNESNEAVMKESKRKFMRVLNEAQNDTDGHCKGVFYWEPECRPSQNKLGAFTKSGRPTIIMQAFKESGQQL